MSQRDARTLQSLAYLGFNSRVITLDRNTGAAAAAAVIAQQQAASGSAG